MKSLIITACHTVMLSVADKPTILSVIMPSEFMLCVIILNVIMLTVSVMIPYCYAECLKEAYCVEPRYAGCRK
jgi:hypothetical protein